MLAPAIIPLRSGAIVTSAGRAALFAEHAAPQQLRSSVAEGRLHIVAPALSGSAIVSAASPTVPAPHAVSPAWVELPKWASAASAATSLAPAPTGDEAASLGRRSLRTPHKTEGSNAIAAMTAADVQTTLPFHAVYRRSMQTQGAPSARGGIAFGPASSVPVSAARSLVSGPANHDTSSTAVPGRAGGQGSAALPPPQRAHAASPLPRHVPPPQTHPSIHSGGSTAMVPVPTPAGGVLIQSRSLPAPPPAAPASTAGLCAAPKPPRAGAPVATGSAGPVGGAHDTTAESWTPLKPASAATSQRILSRIHA
jgi:hypothetical protein